MCASEKRYPKGHWISLLSGQNMTLPFPAPWGSHLTLIKIKYGGKFWAHKQAKSPADPVDLKGLSREMDLAFEDMHGQF